MVSYLRAKRLLPVLEIFEQVTGAAPLVAELLVAAPGLVALVTSRTVLRLTGGYELCAAAFGSAGRCLPGYRGPAALRLGPRVHGAPARPHRASS